MFSKPISWLGLEKQNLTQQKHIFINQNKCTTTQNKHKRTKARFSHLLRHTPWNGEGLFWFRRFINLSLTYLLRQLQPRTHTGHLSHKMTIPRTNWNLLHTVITIYLQRHVIMRPLWSNQSFYLCHNAMHSCQLVCQQEYTKSCRLLLIVTRNTGSDFGDDLNVGLDKHQCILLTLTMLCHKGLNSVNDF